MEITALMARPPTSVLLLLRMLCGPMVERPGREARLRPVLRELAVLVARLVVVRAVQRASQVVMALPQLRLRVWVLLVEALEGALRLPTPRRPEGTAMQVAGEWPGEPVAPRVLTLAGQVALLV